MSSTTSTASATRADSLLDAQGEVIHRATAQTKQATDQVVEAIRDQPLTAALIIFAIGYLMGKIT